MIYKLIEKVKEAKLAKRLNELLENEELEDNSDDYQPWTDREYANARARSKKIENLSRKYWYGEITRDELMSMIEHYNRRKCDDQREISIANILSVIKANYHFYGIDVWENPFQCEKCGCHQLRYQKYVLCQSLVYLNPNGFISYGRANVNEDNEAVGLSGYVCANCGHRLYHCGLRIETEEQLVSLLIMDPEIREQQEKDYENYIKAQISAQEQEEREMAQFDQDMAETDQLMNY